MHKSLSARLGATFLALAASVALPSSWAAPVRAPGPDFPQYASAEELKAACDSSLVQANAQLRQIERRAADGQWLAAYDNFSAKLEDLSSPMLFLSAVHPDKAIRDASEACELRWNDFSSSLGQNETVYRALRAIKPRDAADRLLQKTLLEGFDDAGVGLPPAQRARAKQLNDRIAELGQTFERNIRDGNLRVTFTEAELQGVPVAVWQGAKRDADGRVLLGLDNPSYDPVMQSAQSPVARERMWRAKTTRAVRPT